MIVFDSRIQIDECYEPTLTELRTVFGLQLEQRRNDAVIDNKLFTDIVTARKHVNSYRRSQYMFCVKNIIPYSLLSPELIPVYRQLACR